MRQYLSRVAVLLLFLLSNFLGLAAAARVLSLGPVEVSSAPETGIWVFVMIAIVTAVLLLLYKFNLFKAVKVWFTAAIALSSLLFFNAFMAVLPAAGATVALVALYYLANDLFVHNTATAVAFAGAGAFIGLFLGFVPVLALIVALSIYDAIAVFYTKHMVSLAEKGAASGTFMGFLIPREGTLSEMPQQLREETSEGKKKRASALGGGDVIIPLVFAIATLRTFGPLPSFLSVIGAAVALAVLFRLMQEGRFYPAIPVVSLGSLGMFLLWAISTLL